jgi:hypothetical protein
LPGVMTAPPPRRCCRSSSLSMRIRSVSDMVVSVLMMLVLMARKGATDGGAFDLEGPGRGPDRVVGLARLDYAGLGLIRAIVEICRW